MKRIRFLIPRGAAYSADTSFELYGDLGSGAMDYDRPLPPGRVRLWLESASRPGHLREAHLIVRHLDNVDVDGHLENVHLTGEHLDPVLAVVVESPRYVFGRFSHAWRMFDGAGNTAPQSPPGHVETINEAPAIPRGLKRVSWDGETRRLRLSFERVRFEAVAGS